MIGNRMRIALWVVGAWLLAHLGLIAGHVATVFFYSIAIAPGLAQGAYAEFARESGPWFSIFAGGPVFYFLARWLGRRLAPYGRRAALTVWTLYSVCDLAIVAAVEGFGSPILAAQWVVSQGIKLIAVLLATRSRPES